MNLTFFLFHAAATLGQSGNAGSVAELYRRVVSELPPPDLLVQGRFYQGTNYLAKGHPYLFKEEFTPATVFIQGDRFDGIPLLIDLEKDEVIMEQIVDGTPRFILLSEVNFDSIHIFRKTFIAKRLLPEPVNLSLPELLYHGDWMLVRHYNKRFVSTYSERMPYGRFSALQSTLYVIRAQEAIPIRRRRHLLNLTDSPTEIKSYMRANRIRFKHASDEALITLIKLVEDEG